jgi:hypothetical protein
MKAQEQPLEQLKTLAELSEELDPQGDKVAKAELLGRPLRIETLKLWKKQGKQNVRVIAIDPETGQRVHFNLGEPGYHSIEKVLGHEPFYATIKRTMIDDEHYFDILE